MKLDVVEILKEMVKLDTTNPKGNEYLLTDYISCLLKKHHLSYGIIEPAEGRCNIISMIGPDTERPPLVFISHLDVVPAIVEEWEFEPFSAIEKDGMIYGRGTLDTKFLTAISLVTFITLSKENLDRKIIFIATADEEEGSMQGMPHVVKAYGQMLKNAYIINEGGGFYIENAKEKYYTCTVGEKGKCNVSVMIEGTSSASSFPNDNKSTHKFLEVLERLHAYTFPFEQSLVYEKYQSILGKNIDNSFLKQFVSHMSQDKIVVSNYNIGDAVNLIPKRIEFEFSLHLLPSKTIEDVHHMMKNIFNGFNVQYKITSFTQGFESDLDNPFYKALESVVKKYFCKEATLLPVYALGGTDGRFLGNLPTNVYGCSLVTPKIPFEQVVKLVHAANEKIDVDSLTLGVKAYIDIYRQLGGHDGK